MEIWLSEEALQIAQKIKEEKDKGERKNIPIWMYSCKEQQGEIRNTSSVIKQRNIGKQMNGEKLERIELSSRKSEIPKEHFLQRWAR